MLAPQAARLEKPNAAKAKRAVKAAAVRDFGKKNARDKVDLDANMLYPARALMERPAVALLGKRIPVMFLMLSKGPRKTNRTKTKRYRAKLKAKNKGRRNRIYCRA
jgi:hypothetical protein